MSGSRDAGFSLVELLVALVVGSLMAYALLNAQQYSLFLAADHKKSWESLNLTQKLLAEQGQDELSRPRGIWMEFPDAPGARWRTVQSGEFGDLLVWIDLDTEVHGKEQTWSWPVPK
ncbi:prepilin-type N-terminal cleavage/methylation domain-containing protein [Desulfonatronospira sp.]|uniref:prepilin-type N-terminal cleavage/methylation domain-containing protein n=1 Tax=Desulfonatronospira sp. TaxID=1962951 RepID=UPI0025B7B96D|nr:prepilin-type N-terminal cleavage/methylation domain-containing protein [Desulfonatronospira sp.]